MRIELPELSLVVLIGVTGAGKSAFARRHFKPTEVISSDFCRGLVADDENDQAATSDAFDLLEVIAGKRLKNGLLTVIDATNVRPEDRKRYVSLARQHHCLPVAIVLDLPEDLCRARNALRPDRDFGPHVIRNQREALRRGLGRGDQALKREGYRHIWRLRSEAEVDAAELTRTPLWNNKRSEHGPFDIIGDVHGCFDELIALLESLGYRIARDPEAVEGDWSVTPPVTADGVARQPIFLGDLVDRGPKSPAVLRLVMRLVAEGRGLCVPGNHDMKLLRKLNGKNVQITHGLAETLAQLEGEPAAAIAAFRAFLDGLVSHYVLDDGKLVVAHAGLRADMQGRGSGAVREFCLYGETTGETDEFGLPVRHPWAAEYRGQALVVYGHTPVREPEWLNGTLCVDTGCVFGGRLTALSYPERTLCSVPARAVYATPAKPFPSDAAIARSARQQHDDLLELADVQGKRIIDTRLKRAITLREENAAAALEAMSRFAVDPRWLIYLPPTMSPCETAQRSDLLEHPAQAFAYYRDHGVAEVVCEEKHMGSRAVVVICRDATAARERFGVSEGIGVVYTRTGRRFFTGITQAQEAEVLARVGEAIAAAGLWEALGTTWMCLDCELMPWSAKAQALLREQYAAVGSAGRFALAEAVPVLSAAARRIGGSAIETLLTRTVARHAALAQYTQAYRRYCWPVGSVDELRLAPFHLLASEGAVHLDQDHLWHMDTLALLAAHDPLLLATEHRLVALTDATCCDAAVAWWEALTGAGGEGMVVKPRSFIARGSRGLLQPAVKCRGPEYLRIIYGPEYLAPEHLPRLRARGLNRKRSLALRELALGVEGLERFVRREPLRRVHECVFGVLALESEAVDPRL